MADPLTAENPTPGTDPLGLTGRTVVIGGAGTAGMSAARYLLTRDVHIVLADDRFASRTAETAAREAAVRAVAGVADLLSQGAEAVAIADLLADPSWTADAAVAIVSPGFAPTHDLVGQAAAGGVPVWGEVELAWRVDAAGLLGAPRTWLVVTGTNGKTTTTSMLADIVERSGRAGAACGNIGLPVLDAMRATPRVDVLCAELSSFQLHWAPSVRPAAGVVLNVAEDHLDWHGTFDAYASAKAGALCGDIAVVGLDDPVASGLPGAGRRVGFTLGPPQDGQLGVEDGRLVDRAFGAGRLLPAGAVHPAGPSGVSDALAASALALAIGVGRDAVEAALTDFRPAAHRGEVVATRDGVLFVDDSKATNPHAAQAAVAAYDRVVLIAGGLLKGASMDGMLTAVGDRLAGVVAIGRDRDLVVEAIVRHAPEVPTVTVFTGDDGTVNVHRQGQAEPVLSSTPFSPSAEASESDTAVAVMDRAVAEAWELAAASDPTPDAVLLAPAAASLDMFAGYGRRGDAFAHAARDIAGTSSSSR
ncbi:UDP-N-acetylmuramoyl-L-alanine--D-glutamate ligase [Gordonia amicalis]|uniref:UDP-N-acetylmuramoyl-L-alanine--D-glutamate ligase n=1 Tax=Gordonia amicalis TaxID=89053 RepID=UPI0002A65870|nr:UDP-N-acetylmuramoyl-L-alanine--D-glutamate ligase [Gordonia amicalis]MBA5849560.1 UDP-N-acetylmuramoyl-L-alanine--D-glutamate ligase [Gordonia amicalis]MDV7172062.1 UDP-N-acetylmuramoyl-L-alanine--D-glutamate ligase [Gordonia amicalis]NKX76907.1 UDP-N-acetylmuramoyl-L-alanine--D-glutamate ligase [Gordonia amicalis]GAC51986.1 UDP-N-acetylmuramoylalanine--D-glutamate ligase [Gordonia amicalis NBRC 100051 = JCM 11271]